MDELCSATEPAQMKDVYQTAMNCVFFPKTVTKKTMPAANAKVGKTNKSCEPPFNYFLPINKYSTFR